MSCCCIKTLDLCNVPICGSLEIDQVAGASESGVDNYHTLVLDYFQTSITLRKLQVEGQKINFRIKSLNENFQYTGKIYDASGNLVSIDGYDCIKFKTVQSLGIQSGIDAIVDEEPEGIVVIEAIVDQEPVISGSNATVTGIVDGSFVVTSDPLAGARVFVIRGSSPIPGINPGDGSIYFTKVLGNNFLTFSQQLTSGEFVRIETIPE